MSGILTSVERFATLDRWDSPQASDSTLQYRWPAVTLGEVAEVRLGMQVPRKGSSFSGGVARPYLRAVNVRRGRLDLTHVRTMHLTQAQAIGLTLQAGDLLFVEGSGSVTEVGRVACWDGSISGTVHQNSVIRARLFDDRLDPGYVITWFNSRAGNGYILQQATTTSGLYHIGVGKIANAPIPLASISIQRQIVAEYRKTLRRAEEAERKSAILMSSAWDDFGAQLVDTRKPSANAEVVSISCFSALERWDTAADATGVTSLYPLARLDAIAEVRLGVQLQRSKRGGQDVPYLRVANVQCGYVDLADVKTMNVNPSTIDRLALQRHDLLFLEANSAEEVGRCARWDGQISVCIHQNHVIRARLNSSDIFPRYVEAWFNSPPGRSHVRAHSRTNSGSLYTIPVAVLAMAPVPVPPLVDQTRVLTELDERLLEARSVRADAEQLREQAEVNLVTPLISPL